MGKPKLEWRAESWDSPNFKDIGWVTEATTLGGSFATHYSWPHPRSNEFMPMGLCTEISNWQGKWGKACLFSFGEKSQVNSSLYVFFIIGKILRSIIKDLQICFDSVTVFHEYWKSLRLYMNRETMFFRKGAA